MEKNTHKITLLGGYTDKDNVTHQDVTFGKRLKVKDLINLDASPAARIQTQRDLLLIATSITGFGTLKFKPVPVPFLLKMDTIDLDDLQAGHDGFLQMSRGAGKGEILSDTETKLGLGIEKDGRNYNLVTFGRRFTGEDRAEADRQNLSGVAKFLFEAVRQVEKLTCEETGEELLAPIDEKLFDDVDLEDFDVFYGGSERFRQSFRKSREKAAPEQNAPDGIHSDKGNRDVESGDSQPAG
jgi:hypothetical protein